MNYFDVGLKLTEYLRTLHNDDDGKPLFAKVDFLQSLNDVTEDKTVTPACYVIYRGDSVTDTAGQGKRVSVQQRYTVVLAVAHAASQDNAYDAVKMAGEIIPKLLSAVNGWQANKIVSPLARVGNDQAGFSHTFSYYPFTYETKFPIPVDTGFFAKEQNNATQI